MAFGDQWNPGRHKAMIISPRSRIDGDQHSGQLVANVDDAAICPTMPAKAAPAGRKSGGRHQRA
jgi:hypothetical protein